MNLENNEEGERIIDQPENVATSFCANVIENAQIHCELIAIDFTETVDLQLQPYKKRLVYKLANRKSRLK